MISLENAPPNYNPECGNPQCRRSMMTRFGGEIDTEECPSCEANAEREAKDGMFCEDSAPFVDCQRCRGIGTLQPRFPRLLPVGCPVCDGVGIVDTRK